jgi:hypothetical protein
MFITVILVIETHRSAHETWIYLHFSSFSKGWFHNPRGANHEPNPFAGHFHSLSRLTSEDSFRLLLRPILDSESWSYLTEWFGPQPSLFVFLLTFVLFWSFFDFQRIIRESPFWIEWPICSTQNETTVSARSFQTADDISMHSSHVRIEFVTGWKYNKRQVKALRHWNDHNRGRFRIPVCLVERDLVHIFPIRAQR